MKKVKPSEAFTKYLLPEQDIETFYIWNLDFKKKYIKLHPYKLHYFKEIKPWIKVEEANIIIRKLQNKLQLSLEKFLYSLIEYVVENNKIKTGHGDKFVQIGYKKVFGGMNLIYFTEPQCSTTWSRIDVWMEIDAYILKEDLFIIGEI